MNQNIRQQIALAALLHDIGKFWQRADDSLAKSANMKEYQGSDNAQFVPTFNGRPGYQHALWTHRFIISHGAFFKKVLKDVDIEKFANLSAKHHRPEQKNIEQAIISLADKWSSRNERVFVDFAEAESKEKEAEDPTWGVYPYKKIPLHNIFDLIGREPEDTLKWEERNVFDFAPLKVVANENLKITIFSKKPRIDKNISRQEDYAVLWEQFNNEFKLLAKKCNNFDQAMVSVDALMKKYTWCIPSSTIDMPYSSLYEHSKIVAGISLALYDYYIENNSFIGENFPNYGWQFKLPSEHGDPLLMACIDLSGIQKYIYDISTTYAANALKGRSYNLQLLMRSCINEILKDNEIQLSICNIIYASGGKAYLILPNTEKCLSALKLIGEKLESQFFKTYGTLLYPALGWISFRYQIKFKEGELGYNLELYSNDINFTKENDHATLGDLWRSVSDRAANSKSKRYLHLLENDFDAFFNPQHEQNIIHEQMQKCVVTGVNLKKEEVKSYTRVSVGDDDSQNMVVSKDVYDQIELGKNLKTVMSISESIYEMDDGNHIVNPANLTTTYKLNARHANEQTISFGYNNIRDGDHGLLFYGGNKQPQDNDNKSLTFHEMCLINEEQQKQTHLGVLKMDVDNLGQVFINGLPPKDKSFSAYATLSFYLEAFFSGFINHIRNSEEFKDTIQIIYSGGDDIFAVGRWDKLILFAKEVNLNFHQFTCRDDITLSGGMAIVRPKYPISKAAALADEAEKASKEFMNESKNAFTFFGQTVSWLKEFPLVEKYKEEFLKYALKNKLSTGFLHKIQRYKTVKDDALKKAKKDFSYKWHSAYSIQRIIDSRKSNEVNKEFIEFLETIQENLLHSKEEISTDRYLDILALAARWAEYLLKNKK